MKLTEDQQRALNQILDANQEGRRRHLLTGYAGSGKTTLLQAVVRELEAQRKRIVVTAPTHKAVAVLTKKLRDASIETETTTIHALLGLRPSPSDGERTILKRVGKPQTDHFDVVIIDECSMLGEDLQTFIDADLRRCFVLFVGDPAQLPPVGEQAAQCFATPSRSHLGTVVRQAESNPILQAAKALREQQSGPVCWTWCKPAEAPPHGVYLAGGDASEWMRDAFTSSEFKADNDAFRYVAFTNSRVDQVNRMVRRWIYGDTATPFVPNERVICRSPILAEGGALSIATNEEAVVASIEPSAVTCQFAAYKDSDKTHRALAAWQATIPTWRVELVSDRGVESCCDIPQQPAALEHVRARLKAEAAINRNRWHEHFQTVERFARLQSPYAMTVHTSQGSTFQNVFVDVADIRKLEFSEPLQMQQMLYVAVTRASQAVVLVAI